MAIVSDNAMVARPNRRALRPDFIESVLALRQRPASAAEFPVRCHERDVIAEVNLRGHPWHGRGGKIAGESDADAEPGKAAVPSPLDAGALDSAFFQHRVRVESLVEKPALACGGQCASRKLGAEDRAV